MPVYYVTPIPASPTRLSVDGCTHMLHSVVLQPVFGPVLNSNTPSVQMVHCNSLCYPTLKGCSGSSPPVEVPPSSHCSPPYLLLLIEISCPCSSSICQSWALLNKRIHRGWSGTAAQNLILLFHSRSFLSSRWYIYWRGHKKKKCQYAQLNSESSHLLLKAYSNIFLEEKKHYHSSPEGRSTTRFQKTHRVVVFRKISSHHWWNLESFKCTHKP